MTLKVCPNIFQWLTMSTDIEHMRHTVTRAICRERLCAGDQWTYDEAVFLPVFVLCCAHSDCFPTNHWLVNKVCM